MPWNYTAGEIGVDNMNEDWTQLGYDKFLNRSLQSQDPNYRTSEEFDLITEDATFKSAKMGGKVYVKTLIVNDNVNDRVLIGYQKGGF